MNRTVWLYWEGPTPGYISLCCRTVCSHNTEVVLLDRAGFDALFHHDRDLPIDSLALNHKSDFIRTYLLKHYGGLYVDADCVVLRELGPVLDRAQEYGFAGYREPGGYMSCNFMASVPGGAVIDHHYAQICETIRSRRPLGWLDLASLPMDNAVAAYPHCCHLLPTEQVMPLPWYESERLADRRSDAEHEPHMRSDAFCYMLSNNTIKSRLGTRVLYYMPEADLLADSYFLSYLFRKGLGKEKHEQAGNGHLGGHERVTQFDEGAFEYLTARWPIRSMIDIGCGPPGMVYYARARGLCAIGVDGDPLIARDSPAVIEHDYAHKPLYAGEFDLGWSVEFVEHVEERYVPNFMATLRGCRYVFLTAAVPGQPGYHHVNCRPSEYWIELFRQAGFVWDAEATAGVRSHSTMESRFTQNAGLVFCRG